VKLWYEKLLSGTLICQVDEIEQNHSQTTEGMSWLGLGKQSEDQTIIVDDTSKDMQAA